MERLDALVLDKRQELLEQLEHGHNDRVDKGYLHTRQVLIITVHERTPGQIQPFLFVALVEEFLLNYKGPLSSNRSRSGRIRYVGNVQKHAA